MGQKGDECGGFFVFEVKVLHSSKYGGAAAEEPHHEGSSTIRLSRSLALNF
jgi:hypothetical protein